MAKWVTSKKMEAWGGLLACPSTGVLRGEWPATRLSSPKSACPRRNTSQRFLCDLTDAKQELRERAFPSGAWEREEKHWRRHSSRQSTSELQRSRGATGEGSGSPVPMPLDVRVETKGTGV